MQAIESLLARFPKQRPPLPSAYQAIYHQHYKSNREGNSQASRFAHRFEQWMHQHIAKDCETYTTPYTTLEIGAGTLNHLPYEKNHTAYDIVEPYTALYANSPLCPQIQHFFSDINEVTQSYNRIISIATFEHLENLPLVIARSGLLLKPDGVLRVAIPAEGGFLWKLAWMISTGIEFRLKYKLDYGVLMRHEHINTWQEIHTLLTHCFTTVEQRVFGISPNFSLYHVYICQQPIESRCLAICG
ncbi:class I SAM-dependent methyltransferase [Beggiatoa leptomitoformis]|uniref:Class I SAM-dependent methyltransferase n=2 Tax=Beggiatoa leptomitoformis TaxID=288004 RepID=A0A2N9YJT2_9GAMM|nr:class I SAM-dependent methyltransferase [Beggiatoa leptomitoformis]AUI70586.1 class I SAM-dependent methyltransferase [Beggiatoa leptomitoformis]